jgi:hypothetical protein
MCRFERAPGRIATLLDDVWIIATLVVIRDERSVAPALEECNCKFSQGATSQSYAACATLFVGILAQSGGFFIQMLTGQPNQTSLGNAVTVMGAVLLICAIAVLVYGLITAR